MLENKIHWSIILIKGNAMAEQKSIKKDEFLMRDGEESCEMYYLNTGLLGVYKLKGAVEHQIGTIYAGELVGEMSFLDNEPRCASVRALDDCELTVIPRTRMDQYLQKQPPWLKALHGTLVERLRKANKRIRV